MELEIIKESKAHSLNHTENTYVIRQKFLGIIPRYISEYIESYRRTES